MGEWWERPGCEFRNDELVCGETPLRVLARTQGTPLFAYDAERIRQNLERVHAVMAAAGMPPRVHYAIKANRFRPLLSWIHELGLCGVDVCSPGELLLAREVGFPENAISYTGTSVSDEDLDVVAAHPEVWFNADSLSVIRRLGERCPGRVIGLRVNPGVGLGYRQNGLLAYAGERPTKFGIYRSRFQEALDLAASCKLTVRGIHFHCGCGYLSPQLEALDAVLESSAWFLDQVDELDCVNIGGGLGIPLVADDEPLDLDRWSAVVARHLGARACEVWIEPGDFIVKDAGVLVLQVNTVEEKEGVQFVGVNGGFNVHSEPAFYDLPLHVVPCRRNREQTAQAVTIAGNINEALDVFADGTLLPLPEEGDYLAFLNAGGYGSSMSSDHCRRGHFVEHLLSASLGEGS